MEAAGFLAEVRQRLRRSLLLEGAARVVALGLGIAVCAIAADWAWPTPGWFRCAALIALVAAVAWAARSRLVRPLRRSMDDRALAQFVERRVPALDGRLLTAVDGIGLGADAVVLDQALDAPAARALVPARTLPKWLGMAGGGLALAAIALALSPEARTGIARLALPFADLDWAHGTTLKLELPSAVVPSDRKLAFTITRHHYRHDADDPDFQAPVLVSWEALDGPGAGRRESRQLPGMRGSEWQGALPVLAPGRWRITVESGDAEPKSAVAQSVSRPTLKRVQATLTPPAYAKQPAQQLETIGCAALPGSKLDFAVAFATEPGRKIAKATAAIVGANGAKPLPVTQSADGFASALTIAPGAGVQVQLAAEDQDGIAIDPPPTFSISLIEDHAPAVSLSGPGANEAVTTHATVGVAIDASDDYGLGALEMRGQTIAARPAGAADEAPPSPPGPAKTLAAFPDAADAAATTRKAAIKIADLAALGEQLLVTGWARDLNVVTGPGETTSSPILLRVVTDEALRQELDRLLAEARERASQAREEVGSGLAKPAKLVGAARSAALATGKCGDLVGQVVRRWGENAFPADQIAPAAKAGELLRSAVDPKLAAVAAGGGDGPAREADAALAEVEKLLGSLLQEGNLTRRLADLIAKQANLNEESRQFVLEHLTKPLDAAAKTRQANIAERQKGVSDEMKELERDVLASPSAQLDAAKKLVRESPVGDQLAQAAGDVASEQQRSQAVEEQKSALDGMKKLLEALRGGDAAGDLADRIGEVAAKEEALVKELESGKRPQELEQRQQQLGEEMKRLEAEAKQKNDDAGKAVAAAESASDSASGEMRKGDSSGSSRDAQAAAALLREAQRKLGGDSDQDKDQKDKDKKQADVMALLRELLAQQSALVADVTILHQTQGEKPLDFTAQRAVADFAQRQSDILLRLREEGIKPLENNPIASVALARVATAMEKAGDHLQTPALGEKGMRLEKIALAELQRLVDIADNTPPSNGQQGGQGNGNGNQAPFPPEAELALLAAMQEELSRLTDANRPVDVAKGQADLRDLVEKLENATRPGSRPNVLLARAARAMSSAASLLTQKDRGLTTRHEQLDAEDEIRRMIAELKSGGGGGSGGSSSPRPKQQRQNGQDQQSPPTAAQPKNGGGASSGGNSSKQQAKTVDPTVVTADQRANGLRLDLPEERREQLKQAREQNLAPRAMQLYERYLELLEDGK